MDAVSSVTMKALSTIQDVQNLSDQFGAKTLVARGGYSEVYRAEWVRSGAQLASMNVCYKVLRPPISNMLSDVEQIEKTMKHLTREMKIWKSLDHGNIVEFIGFAIERRDGVPEAALVSEWCSNGNLVQYLQCKPSCSRLPLLLDVARGLTYLHDRDPVVVHGDLKPLNILISDAGHAKLCDFGLSLIADGLATGHTSSGPAFTLRYCAPEIVDSGVKTTSGDIYSFACICAMILFDGSPFPSLKNDAQLLDALRFGRPPWDWKQSSPVEEVLSSCCAISPDARPTMRKVFRLLVDTCAEQNSLSILKISEPKPLPPSRTDSSVDSFLKQDGDREDMLMTSYLALPPSMSQPEQSPSHQEHALTPNGRSTVNEESLYLGGDFNPNIIAEESVMEINPDRVGESRVPYPGQSAPGTPLQPSSNDYHSSSSLLLPKWNIGVLDMTSSKSAFYDNPANLNAQPMETPDLPSKVLRSLPALALKPSKVDKQPTEMRKRTDEDDEDGPRMRHASGHAPGPHAFEYDENVDEKSLASMLVIINRAPVMTAWAAVVAERLKFTRAEALSIASVYAEKNASSKGVALGIFHKDKDSDFEGGSTQPYIELMGRKIPVMKTDAGEWRGIVKGEAAEPEMAYRYIQRSFKHLMGSVIGSMQLLQESYSPEELNKNGYDLYSQFRPGQGGWGQRGEMRMQTLLDLRRQE